MTQMLKSWKNDDQVKKLYFNAKQVEFYAGMCQTNVALCSRGFGKTTGITPMFLHNVFTELPRSLTLAACKTYKSVIFNILPGILKTFDNLGYVEREDYWIMEKPPQDCRPLYKLPKFDQALTFGQGSVALFGSMDKGFYNSLSFDSMIFEEARLLKKEKIDEVTPALRGNLDVFGGHWLHHSKLYVSDKPKYANDRWLYDIAKQCDDETIKWIFAITFKIYEAYEKLFECTDANEKKKIEYYINSLTKDLVKLKRGNVYYFQGSALDNAELLGINAIKELQRTLTVKEFKRAGLNMDVLGDDDGFYFMLNDNHKYTAINYHPLEIGKVDFRNPEDTAEWDDDIIDGEEMHIACDWGGFNCMVVGQFHNDTFKVLRNFHTNKTEDLIAMFCKYYMHKSNKRIHLYHDQTAIGQDGRLPYISIVQATFMKYDWDLTLHYFGAAPEHQVKFELWQKIFQKRARRSMFFQINETNCEDTIISMESAKTKEIGNVLKKDKGSERDKTINQAHATHLSDAVDQLIYGLFAYMLDEDRRPTYIPMVYG